MAEHEAALPMVAEAADGLFLLVHGGHVPPLAVELKGDIRTDAAAADDECLHCLTLAHSRIVPSSSITPSGKATTSTSHGAFFSTYSTVGEKKRA